MGMHQNPITAFTDDLSMKAGNDRLINYDIVAGVAPNIYHGLEQAMGLLIPMDVAAHLQHRDAHDSCAIQWRHWCGGLGWRRNSRKGCCRNRESLLWCRLHCHSGGSIGNWRSGRVDEKNKGGIVTQNHLALVLEY